MSFYPGFDIVPTDRPIGFRLGAECFGHGTEIRKLDAIRKSLLDPRCAGPEDVYAIMMDVGMRADYEDLKQRHLLYGAVCYAGGTLGREPVRSQGHIHKISARSGCSTPEVYEIWTGKAIVYMQESGDDDPGRCFAVTGLPGDVIVVPPYWTHATVNADPATSMSFGAWCDRDYGFVYDKVRAHNGIAWFPLADENGGIVWERNPRYRTDTLIEKRPERYEQLGLTEQPIYTQYRQDRARFDFVPDPRKAGDAFERFVP